MCQKKGLQTPRSLEVYQTPFHMRRWSLDYQSHHADSDNPELGPITYY